MKANQNLNTSKISIDTHDIKCAIDGLVHIAEDTLLRDMAFDRNKICTFANVLRDLSRTLDTVIDRTEALERR